MKTKYWLFLILLVQILVAQTAAAAGRVVYGSISVNSVPPGAMIYVDGEIQASVTPCVLKKIPVGEHKVTLARDDMLGEIQVTVEKKKTSKVEVELKPASKPIPPTNELDKVHKPWFWTSVAVLCASSAVAAVGLGMYYREKGLGDDAFADYRNAVANNSGLVSGLRQDVIDHDKKMNDWQIVGWTMAGIGVAAGASAIAAWFLNKKGSKDKDSSKVTFAPILGDDSVGIVSLVSF